MKKENHSKKVSTFENGLIISTSDLGLAKVLQTDSRIKRLRRNCLKNAFWCPSERVLYRVLLCYRFSRLQSLAAQNKRINSTRPAPYKIAKRAIRFAKMDLSLITG